MNVLHRLLGEIERLEKLDDVASPLARLAGQAFRPRVIRNLLSGTAVGHPVHPVLTDVPIGAWSMAVLLDAAGKRAEPGADLLFATGIAAAVPTAVAGLTTGRIPVGQNRGSGWYTRP
jgi:hypothetical protein